jgi:hypothetical protein
MTVNPQTRRGHYIWFYGFIVVIVADSDASRSCVTSWKNQALW